METKVFINSTGNAAEIVRAGGLVAVPTETVYGLAANGLDAEAVQKIYDVKGRPAVKPLSLMVPGKDAIGTYLVDAPQAAFTLAEKFWPGPLTIVGKAADFIPPIVLAGGSTVGLRCPDNALTRTALEEAGVPFAAPSANPSGEESPKDASRVLRYFDGKIDAVIDGGKCSIGMESTLIDVSTAPYRILRSGALGRNEIADALAEKMIVVGISGGTGSGKSSLLHYLEKKGAFAIDCDEVYHELLAHSEEMNRTLRERFPGAYPLGTFNRKALGEIVFNDGEALDALNAISHSYVKEEVRRMLREAAMQGKTLAAIDAIELHSSGLAELCIATVGVLADPKIRAQRIMRRDSISEEYANSRIRAQRTDEYFREKSNFCVENNGTLADLIQNYENQVKAEKEKHQWKKT